MKSVIATKRMAAGLSLLVCIGLVAAKPKSSSTSEPSSPAALQAEIDALSAAKVAWREIAWKSCLLEGLQESRAKNKPALLWVFIDRPIDDERC
jgi:hypothetical protein